MGVPADRRIKSLALTGEGRRVRDQILDELWTTVPILDGLTGAERRELRRLLEKSAGASAPSKPLDARSSGG